MAKGNVLVIGDSGVGKSTLIKAFLKDESGPETGGGTEGTTKHLKIYSANKVPFQLIDTIGFEPNFRKRWQAILAVKKWSKEAADKNGKDGQINAIWFCVDGTSRKLFPEAIHNLSSATALWKTVPVIVVITKSYSVPDREENIRDVKNAFDQQRHRKNLKAVIPVVAEQYNLNETAFAPQSGIEDLIDATNAVLPDGLKAAASDIAAFKLSRKRLQAQSMIAASTAAGAAVGMIPLPFADAAILGSVETALVTRLSKIYEIPGGGDAQKIIETILEAGTVSAVAKAAISSLKAIPGVNLAGEVINAIVASAIVAAIGEGSAYVFDKIYLGEMSAKDIDAIRRSVEEKLDDNFVNKVTALVENLANSPTGKNSAKELAGAVLEALGPDSASA